MRGVVSAGMVAALERLGMRDAFDLIVGSSAGAINGVALLSGVAQRAADAYCGPLASRSFVNPLRVLRGKPVIDVNDVLTIVTATDVAGHERVISGDTALHCIATDVASATGVDLHGMRTQDDVWTRDPRLQPDALGGRTAGGDRRAPLPRRRDGLSGSGRRGDRRRRHARARAADAPVRHPAQERVTYRRPSDRAASARSQSRAGDGVPRADRKVRAARRRPRAAVRRPRPGAAPHVLGLRPPADTPCVGQLERNPVVLTAGATDGERLVEAALGAGGREASVAPR